VGYTGCAAIIDFAPERIVRLRLLLRVTVAAALMIPVTSAAQIPTRNMEVKAHFNDYPPGPGASLGAGYSSCWSYVHGDGREYAVIGTSAGTAIYNVTDPDATYFVEFIPGIRSLWREMKSYRNWIYVVTEGFVPAGGDPVVPPGIQIISMVDPENPVLASTWAGSFNRAHSVSVDTTRGLLICNGTNLYVPPSGQTPTGMRILSLADPLNPVDVGAWPAMVGDVPPEFYVHDSVPIGTRLYASSVYAGIQRVIDFTVPSTPVEVASWSYPGAFTHNAWPDSSGSVLYVTDEVNGEPLKVFDIAGLPAQPTLTTTLTSNPLAIVHNAHVQGRELFLANYTEGTRVLDISDPRHPAEFAWADSYLGGSGGFAGVWGVCPYFPSGTVIASDMQTGLWVYRPVRDYGLIHVQVTDGVFPLAGAEVFLSTQGDSATTGADGILRFAPNPGLHTVKAAKFGYGEASVVVPVTQGETDTVTIALALKPTAHLCGTIFDAATLAPLEEAEADLRYTPVHAHTAVDGQYHMPMVPADVYRMEFHRPGYVPRIATRSIDPGTDTLDVGLRAATTWEKFEAASGWLLGAPGDNATAGFWIRATPSGTATTTATTPGGGASARAAGLEGAPRPGNRIEHGDHEYDGATPGQVAPATDRTPGGTMCFVTGNNMSPVIDDADLDGGRTTLTSPGMALLAAYTDPAISYWRWFYTQFSHPDDWLAVLITNDNGATWIPVDTTRAMGNHWVEKTIRVADYVAPTNMVRVRFVANDGGTASVVEAGIDDVTTYDLASPVGVGPAALPRLALRALGANPSRGTSVFALESPSARDADVAVFDVSGRRVRTLWRGRLEAGARRLLWDGRSDAGDETPAGLYFVRVVAGGETAETRLARIQ
jgi:choice-of-anchor B domain-containing protein